MLSLLPVFSALEAAQPFVVARAPVKGTVSWR
jgi:hypothetical protein